MEKEYKWFVFYNGSLLLCHKGDGLYVPTGVSAPVNVPDGHIIHEVTMNNGTVVKTFSLDTAVEESECWSMIGLRQTFCYIPFEDYLCAGKASQILYWDSHSCYCPSCGVKTVKETDIMKKCPKCGLEIYPPISTAIIVLIRRGEEILLVHSRNFKGTFYGLVAGFLEAGESLEECVVREVREETGLEIANITYFASQTWPFPSGLMVGFVADYVSGEIKIQEDELTAGAFYNIDNLPEIPQKMSIARRLIDWWVSEHK